MPPHALYHSAMSKKILIVSDDAGESFEILYALHRLREAGYEPVLAASEKKRLNAVIHDFAPGWNTYIERPGYLIESDLAFKEVNVSDYTALLIPGGRAPEFLRHNPDLIKIVREFQRQDKWLFAICHGIQILLAAGIGRGLKLTCYENVRFELESVGGTWVNQQCVRDGKIVTGQTWQSHPEFYREVMALLSK
jgi:protease I